MKTVLTATDPVCGHVAAAIIDPGKSDAKSILDYARRGLMVMTKQIPDKANVDVHWCPLECPQRAVRRAKVGR